MRIPLALFALTSSCISTLALDLKGHIQWNEHCEGLGALGQAKVVLDNGKLHGGVLRDGSFLIPDVPEGMYVLSVLAHDHAFEQMRVDVYESETLPEVRPYFPGTPLSPSTVTLPYPITLSARGKHDYFVPRESFNVLAMFKNPMMMMMLLAGGLVLLTPTMMKNMDPEIMEEFKERHAKMSGAQSALQSGDLMGGFSQLLSAANEEAKGATSGAVKGPGPSGTKHRSGKNKKR